MIETLGMEMAAGRSFSDQYGSDSAKIILNETGIKATGLKNPVGKIFTLWGKDYQIIGVLKDFNFESLRKEVKPMFFRFEPNELTRVMIKVKAGMEKQMVGDLQQFYKRFNPGFVLDYKFLDQDFLYLLSLFPVWGYSDWPHLPQRED
ncbi:hypothetical protein D3C85_1172250 [compost metagenome]